MQLCILFHRQRPTHVANLELVLHANVQLSLSCAFGANAHVILKHSSVRSNFKTVYSKTINAPSHKKANIWHAQHMRWDRQERKRKHRRNNSKSSSSASAIAPAKCTKKSESKREGKRTSQQKLKHTSQRRREGKRTSKRNSKRKSKKEQEREKARARTSKSEWGNPHSQQHKEEQVPQKNECWGRVAMRRGQHSKHKRKPAIASLIAIVISLQPTSGHVLPRGSDCERIRSLRG